MNLQRPYVPSAPFAFGRWVVISILLIVISTLATGYSTVLWYGSDLSAFVRMICLPSLCVSIGQYRLLLRTSPTFQRWVGASTISTAIGLDVGWMLVLAGVAFLNMYGASIAIRSDALATTIITGSGCGFLTGVITGMCASLGQWAAIRSTARLTGTWLGANMISWGFGLAIIGGVVFGILSQATFSF